MSHQAVQVGGGVQPRHSDVREADSNGVADCYSHRSLSNSNHPVRDAFAYGDSYVSSDIYTLPLTYSINLTYGHRCAESHGGRVPDFR